LAAAFVKYASRYPIALDARKPTHGSQQLSTRLLRVSDRYVASDAALASRK